jgi:hypothetical protein
MVIVQERELAPDQPRRISPLRVRNWIIGGLSIVIVILIVIVLYMSIASPAVYGKGNGEITSWEAVKNTAGDYSLIVTVSNEHGNVPSNGKIVATATIGNKIFANSQAFNLSAGETMTYYFFLDIPSSYLSSERTVNVRLI